MSKDERAIRFNVALEIVEEVHKDFCKSEGITRQECIDFNDLIISMIQMHEKLKMHIEMSNGSCISCSGLSIKNKEDNQVEI